MKRECPTCGGTNPAWHPAVQSGGEVHLCEDGWHKPTAAEIRERDPRYPPKMAFEDWQCRPCRHEWGAMTGRAPVHCPECGATNIERIFHGVCLDTKGKS